MNYKDLNKYTQKDYFPLSFITSIVDDEANHNLYNFIDSYFGYNQILIACEDCHKTTFISSWEIFVYVIVSFDLCNVLLAFQRVMTYFVLDLFQKTLLFFINDFIYQLLKNNHLKSL